MLLFDIDGTLLYTGGSGRIAFEKAFQELFGLPDVWQNLIPDGKTDPLIIEEIVQRVLKRPLLGSEYEKLTERYHEIFDIEILNPPKFYLLPGVVALLEKLSKNQSLSLGVATGNFERAAWSKLKKGNIHHFFSYGGFASDAGCRTELTRIAWQRGQETLGRSIAKDQVILIGDTPFDIKVGKELGFFTVGVATGRTSVQEFLEKYKADIAFQDLSDTEAFLELLS